MPEAHPQAVTDDYKEVRLACSHGPDIHFNGKLVGEYTTQNRAGTKSRWTELRLWETPGLNLVAEKVGCSSREGEGTIRDARQCHSPTEVMELFEWSTAAKAFARELGWNVTMRVE